MLLSNITLLSLIFFYLKKGRKGGWEEGRKEGMYGGRKDVISDCRKEEVGGWMQGGVKREKEEGCRE